MRGDGDAEREVCVCICVCIWAFLYDNAQQGGAMKATPLGRGCEG